MKMRASLLAAALWLLPTAGWAEGRLDYIGKFYASGEEFDIALYTEAADKVAVIGIDNGQQQRSSVAFAPNEWHAFVELWSKARTTQSGSWQLIGTFTEIDTEEKAMLTVMAGPGIQLNINGKKGPFVFVLSPGDYGSFDAAVQQMSNTLAQ